MVESPVGAIVPSYFCGTKRDLGVVLDVEDVVVHLLVAAGFAAVAAACGNHDRAGDSMRGAIEVDGAALYMEGAIDMMAAAGERECDLAGVGIDGESSGAGRRRWRQKAARKDKSGAEEVFQSSILLK